MDKLNIIIGIIDIGIWQENPSLADHDINEEDPKRWRGSCEGGTNLNSSLCNKKIIGASYFKATYNSTGQDH